MAYNASKYNNLNNTSPVFIAHKFCSRTGQECSELSINVYYGW